MGIDFDSTNLLAGMVGPENGLTPKEWRDASPSAANALKSFRKSYEAGDYGFPDLPFQTRLVKELQRHARQMQGSYDTVCLVGIGGSALGAWALDCALRGPHPVQKPFSKSHPRLVVLDNVDPDLVMAALEAMEPKKTVVVVIAKSGATAETVANFLLVREWLESKLGRKAAQRIVAVTSEDRGELKVLATNEGYSTFHIPGNVGGRFSVLSAVGLLPAALLGIDIAKLCRGAAEMTDACWKASLDKNIALRAALNHYLIWTGKNKPIQVAFPYSNRLWGVAFWFRQLWAESLGKARTRAGETVNIGQTPVAALGATDQHSQVQLYIEGPNDKVYTFWTVRRRSSPGRLPKQKLGVESMDYLAGQSLEKLLDAEQRSTAAALTENNRPNGCFALDRLDEAHLGAFLQLLEFKTAFVGELLNINAFDQEGVELGKRFTFGLMGRSGFDSYRERLADYEKRQNQARRMR